MPLFTLEELEQMTPLFHGKTGRTLGRCAMKLLAINRVNTLYDRYSHLCGTEFTHNVLKDLGIKYDILAETPEVLTQLNEQCKDTSYITISNHPYGSIDGVILADCFGQLFPNYKIITNKILERVEALSSSFIPVTPTGPERSMPTRESILGIRHAFTHLTSGGSLGLFPAGAVSNFSLRDGKICDREWQLPIIRFIAKARVPILPVRFFGGNSWFYYLLGLIDWRIRLLRLPAEVFNKAHTPILLGIGSIISVEQQQEFLTTHSVAEFGQWLRGKVYDMSMTD